MVDAMNYEYLIRKIYHCGRGGVEGADADIYRRMERVERIYLLEEDNIKNKKPRIRFDEIEDLEDDYRRQASIVGQYIIKALNKLLKDHSENLTSTDQTKINHHILELGHRSTSKSINEAISKVEPILMELGLKAL